MATVAAVQSAAGPGVVGGAEADALRRNFQDLKSKVTEVRANAIKSIRLYLEFEAQERSREVFKQIFQRISERIQQEYSESSDSERMGFLMLIDELTLLAAEKSQMQVGLLNLLLVIIRKQEKQSAGDMSLLSAGMRALGHLARSSDPRLTHLMFASELDGAVKRLIGDQSEVSRHYALMVVTELSANAPTLIMNNVLKTFFDNIWTILCDSKLLVRVRAALALRNLLVLEGNRLPDKDEQRITGMRYDGGELYKKARSVFPPAGQDWTNKKKPKIIVQNTSTSSNGAIDPEVAKQMAKDPFHPKHVQQLMRATESAEKSIESERKTRLGGGEQMSYDYTNVALVHAALLTLYELLDPAARAIDRSYFLEILNCCIWRDDIRHHKDPLILHQVIALLPRMARLCKAEMRDKYYEEVVKYLLNIIKASSNGRYMDRAMAFRALGQLAVTSAATSSTILENPFGDHVLPVIEAIEQAIDPKKKGPFCEEAIEGLDLVISSQSRYGLKEDVELKIKMVHGMLLAGSLSETVVATLVTIGKAVPSLVKVIQKQLFSEIAFILNMAGSSVNASRLGGNVVGDAFGRGTDNSRVPGKRPWRFFTSSSSSTSSGSSALTMIGGGRERMLLKTLEQRLGLLPSTADPFLIASLQGIIDGTEPHPASIAVAEAASKGSFGWRSHADFTSANLSPQELDTYRQRLALRTLGTFDFTGVTILPLVMAAVVQFLESTNPSVRLEAVIACCRLLSTAAEGSDAFPGSKRTREGLLSPKKEQGQESVKPPTGGDPALADYRTAADYVVERLVVMALTDSDPDIRCRVVEELDSPKFRTILLENPENLRSLFVLVNDQHFGVRAAALVAIGHLAERAPGYIVPALRTVLVRLLTELDFGGDIRHREESATLLGLLVQSVDPPLCRPHVDSTLKGLLPKLSDSNQKASAAAMAALGEVANVARDSLLVHIGKILEVLMKTLAEDSSHGFLEREVALSTLSKVCKATIMSIWPYFYQRRLLDVILQMMINSASPWSVRRQAMIALGTLGALDPWLHKKNERESQTIAMLGRSAETDWFVASSLESPEFAAQRYSLASSVFDFAFGGGQWDSDDEDEFETEFEDEVPENTGNTSNTSANGTLTSVNWLAEADRHHWKLAPRALVKDAIEDGYDDIGADLDAVFRMPPRLVKEVFETNKGGPSPMLGTATRLSGGLGGSGKSSLIMGRPVEGLIGEDAEAGGQRQHLRQRVRRDSLQLAAAGIAPATAAQVGAQSSAVSRAIGQGHARRQSHIIIAGVTGSTDLTGASIAPAKRNNEDDDADEIKAKEKATHTMNNADRHQRLRALAAGARMAAGDDALGVFGLDPSTILPSMVPEHYDATVSVTALVRVLNDGTAELLRKREATSSILMILSLVAQRSKDAVRPFLPHVVPALITIAKQQLSANTVPMERTWPLLKIGELVEIVQRDYRAYLPQTFEMTRPYYGDQQVLTNILKLAQTIARNLEARSLQLYVPALLPELLGILRAERENLELSWTNTPAVLQTIATLGSALSDYLYLVLPNLMRLVDQTFASGSMVGLEIRVLAVETLDALVQKCDVADYASRLIHPLCRAISETHIESGDKNGHSPRNRAISVTALASAGSDPARRYTARTLFYALLNVLTSLVFRLEEEFVVFIPMVEEAIQHTMNEAATLGSKNPLHLHGSHDLEPIERYRALVQRVLRGQALPKPSWYKQDDDIAAIESEGEGEHGASSSNAGKIDKNDKDSKALAHSSMLRRDNFDLRRLREIVQPTQRTSDDDWTEWMRQFSTELLACSPSAALAACHSLAQLHQPLAMDLFNAAFAAVWVELCRGGQARSKERSELMAQLEQALNSHPPKNILQILLNLAEFMEHDDKPLPLDMIRLGELAFQTQAYAKSLHYKEIAFRVSPERMSEKWLEKMALSLIVVNKNLDQINAAHGIVEYLRRNNPNQEHGPEQPSWYAQLGIWEKALKAYEDKDEHIRMRGANAVFEGLTEDEIDINQGKMQCLKALGEWDKLARVSDEKVLELKKMYRQARLGDGKRDDGRARGADDDVGFGRFTDELNGSRRDVVGAGGSSSNVLASTYGFDRFQGYGDRSRPVTILLKNSNRALAAVANTRAFHSEGPRRLPVSSSQMDPGSGQATVTGGLPGRRVSYLEGGSTLRPTTLPVRRTPSGVGLSELAGHHRSSRSSLVDDNRGQQEMRYGRNLDDHTDESSKLAQYRQEAMTLGAYANWMLRKWQTMRSYVQGTSEETYDGNFLRAVLDIEDNDLDAAEARVEVAFRKLGQEVTSNFGETYSRAYSRIVRVQELAELQELIAYKRIVSRTKDGRQEEAKLEFASLKKLWRQRLQGVQQNVDVLLPILAVRSMIVEPREDIDTWLNFAKVARKQGRKLLSLKALMNLGIGSSDRMLDDDGYEEENVHSYMEDGDQDNDSVRRVSAPNGGSIMASLTALHEDDRMLDPYPTPLFPSRHSAHHGKVHPRVLYAYINHLWTVGDQEEKIGKQQDAVQRLKKLAKGLTDVLQDRLGPGYLEYVGEVPSMPPASSATQPESLGPGHARRKSAAQARGRSKLSMASSLWDEFTLALNDFPKEQLARLAVRASCQLGEWIVDLHDSLELESSPQRSASIARDVNSVTSYTSKGVLQSSQRPRGMVSTMSFISSRPGPPGSKQDLTSSETDKLRDVIPEALKCYETAIQLDSTSHRAWRMWALTNFEAVRLLNKSGQDNSDRIVCAIAGLFRSIELGSEEGKTSVLQDTLRLLQLWFSYEELPQFIEHTLTRHMDDVPKTTWLEVIPQLIARVNTSELVCELLTRIGRDHPQQLLFPLTVAADHSPDRGRAAEKIMKTLERRHPVLVEQARLVSKELIRVAVLWPEMWNECLEEASQYYFSPNRDIDRMLETLEALHKRMEDPGPETLSEVGFAHAFGRDLKEAHEWLQAYKESNREDLSYLNQAWDLYYKVFKTVSKQLDVKSLELRRVSPQLLHASSLEVAVPGRYVGPMGEAICIERFSPTLRVIKSKQRPRVITMRGSDGADHMFLLKGHEDLRLDERVMQLLGLVNNLLAADGETHRADVEIQKYAVVPLSPRAGVMQWVPHCDTLHELVKEYRETRKIPVNVEYRVTNDFAPNYEQLTTLQKVEVFQHAIRETSGQDFAKVLWLKSANSETWLDRRTNYTRSLAAMSIVGYVLGLGDRHPSNLMCERASGRILHIDFGDCFEVAMHRQKFPEGVPFRLTRMLVNAMEVSGVEGNFRITCQNVMRVIRENKDSVVTMLEAFLHDPLFTWRLFQPERQPAGKKGAPPPPAANTPTATSEMDSPKPTRAYKPSTMRFAGLGGDLPADSNIGSVMEYGYGSLMSAATRRDENAEAEKTLAAEKNNRRAVEVMERVKQKLNGTDFDPKVYLDVNEQVDRLIKQAQNHENLAVMYTGWSATW